MADDAPTIDWSTTSIADTLHALYGWTGTGARAIATPDADTPGLVVPAKLWERLQAFALTEKPNECCGIGIGPVGEVREFYPLENVHETPVTRYEISARDQLRIHQRAEEQGWDVTLVFHSHPATEPEPSVTDRSLAGWPDAVYAIIGLENPSAAKLRAWRIVDDAVTELPVALS